MNRLSTEKRATILGLLVEGMSMRSVSRATGVSINTVTKLLVDAGEACAECHDETVRGVRSKRVQCDETWSFCYAKAKHVLIPKAAPAGAGDVWTWTAIDADTKLIIAYEIGDRSAATRFEFMNDLRLRLANRMQLTTDGNSAYLSAVEETFGADVDYAMLVKQYGQPTGREHERRYSPPECIGVDVRKVSGYPDPDHINTSYVERQNLTMRMGMRRFTGLTNAFSKKLENHLRMLSLYFVHYNFCRRHMALRVSPAMAAGLTDVLRDLKWLVGLIKARTPPPTRPTTYRRRGDISN